MLTQWGYEVERLEPILKVNQFHKLTNNKFAKRDTDEIRINLQAISEQIRNYCSWHVAPVLTCEIDISANGANNIKLPALIVDDVFEVYDDGEEVEEVEWSRRGRVRKSDKTPFSDKLDAVHIKYSAGTQSPLIERIIVQATTNLLTAPVGIREEHAGGIGVSYVANGEELLPQRALRALSPYRLASI